MTLKEEICNELCMMTGVVSNDVTLLYYNLIKDMISVDDFREPYSLRNVNTVDTLEDWFANMEDVANE